MPYVCVVCCLFGYTSVKMICAMHHHVALAFNLSIDGCIT